jgi:hypothetical protein
MSRIGSGGRVPPAGLTRDVALLRDILTDDPSQKH